MFTGIVDHCGQIIEIIQAKDFFRLAVHSKFSDLRLGESIAIDGVCFTVAEVKGNTFFVDLSQETLSLTIAGRYNQGRQVNLERSLRLVDRLGGHFVTGHVDGTARVASLLSNEGCKEVKFNEVSRECRAYLVKKGSVSINGVSLTLNEVREDTFKVVLIPHTLQTTNLAILKVEDRVNIEFDYLAKIVTNYMSIIV